MKDTRPKNLNLFAIKWPLAAITSITHRISGIFIFIGVAILLYLLEVSLESAAGFDFVLELLAKPLVKLLVWAIVAGLLYHLIAGIKHLLMDFGIGESKQGSLRGAQLTILFAVIAIAVAGVWIW
ncbi:MAG: succinate dehydrogenase, cytochrome b556 subunit [Gammaproteobacteria bacterium]|nr:succinate dehydrogenase, cytochrome b556 subunit [Gammaproteobacteria bacterium]